MLLKETKWIQMIMVWNNKKERHFSWLKHLFFIHFLRYYSHLFSEGKYYVYFTFVKWNKWVMLTCYQGEYFILLVLFKSEIDSQWPHRREHFSVQQNVASSSFDERRQNTFIFRDGPRNSKSHFSQEFHLEVQWRSITPGGIIWVLFQPYTL